MGPSAALRARQLCAGWQKGKFFHNRIDITHYYKGVHYAYGITALIGQYISEGAYIFRCIGALCEEFFTKEEMSVIYDYIGVSVTL